MNELLVSRGCKPKKGGVVICEYCGKEFYLRQSHLHKKQKSIKSDKRYCSQGCYTLSLRTNKERKCIICGKRYYVSKSQVFYRNINCCSNKCRYKNQKNKAIKLSQKIKIQQKKEGKLPRHIYYKHLKTGDEKNRRALINKLDRIFSLFIRKSASVNGWVSCFTCNRKYLWKEVDAGHYVSRSYSATRFNEKNVKPQCRKCNRFEGGRMDDFAIGLIKLYGKNILEELNKEKYQQKCWQILELQTLIDKYKELNKNSY